MKDSKVCINANSISFLIITSIAMIYTFVLHSIISPGNKILSILSNIFNQISLAYIWLLIFEIAYSSAAKLYSFKRKEIYLIMPKEIANIYIKRISALNVIISCFASYALTLYGYALSYSFVSSIDPNAFNRENLSLFDYLYFSIVTSSTLGYGDIYAVSTVARLIVIAEILTSSFYVVFFFSIIASAVRMGIDSGKD